MSVRQGLLALLEERPMYGYQLRAEFEARTGATWPLNVGQVYTTLARLERDGLVEPAGEDDEGHAFYGITDAGRAAVASWFEHPGEPRDAAARRARDQARDRGDRPRRRRPRRGPAPAHRDDARAAGLHPPQGARDRTDDRHDLAWLLVLDSLVFAAEAEIRWLDHCEARLARAALDRRARAGTAHGAGDRAAKEARR